MAELTKQQQAQTPLSLAESRRAEFLQLAGQWKRETAHLSRIWQKVGDPAYQEIISMGECCCAADS